MRGELLATTAVATLLALAACGGGKGPSAPAAALAMPPPDSLASGTAIQIVSGETGAGVDGASVTVAGRAYTSVGGRVTLADRVPLRAELDVLADGMLERKTLVRDPATTSFTLWPTRSPTGMDEGYTQAIVYSRLDGAAPLRRLQRGTSRVAVVPSADLLADEQAMASHQEAVDRLTAATGGRVVYALDRQRPASGVYVESRLDAGDPTCSTSNVLAFAQVFTRSGEVVRGLIVYCDYKVARTSIPSHEMGHTFGLFHSPDKAELMYAYYNGHGGVDFSPRETLAMNLMLQRPGGNLYPDDDRGVSASTELQSHITVCRADAR
jgi:predicted small lipoprotein YifL